MPEHRHCRWFNPIGYTRGRLVGTCLRHPSGDAYHGLGDGDATACADFEGRCDACPSAVGRRPTPVPHPLSGLRVLG
jgi:hypothetical protein